jgi:hypothetical protein
MQTRPTWHDVYDAQLALADWMRPGRPGAAYMRESFAASMEDLLPENRDLLANLYRAEPLKMRAADPIFVSEEMCEVVEAAAATFQTEPLVPADLMTACGFMAYERPFWVPDRFDEPTNIAAVSWTPLLGETSKDLGVEGGGKLIGGDPADLLRRFNEIDYIARWQEEDRFAPDGLGITLYTTNERDGRRILDGPPLVPMHMTPWWFGMSYEGNEVDQRGRPTGASWWWRIVQTTFRLMQQTIVSRRAERPDRTTRRRAKSLDFDDRDVVVVRLRRERDPRPDLGGPTGEANYSHRFIVGGHWRNQWYPSERTHRQIWISPYVKGPEDAPLVVRPTRAMVWSR